MKTLPLCAALLATGLSGHAAAAENGHRTKNPNASQWMAAIVYSLAARPIRRASLPSPDRTSAEPSDAYRLAPHPAAVAPLHSAPPVTLHRSRLSFAPHRAEGVGLHTIRPVTRTGRFDLSAQRSQALWNGTQVTLGWHATRLASHDGTITADGGTAYRRTGGDLFLPAIAFRATIATGLVLKVDHEERMRANRDTAFFGPRSMTLPIWALRDRHADFEHSVSDSARLYWSDGRIDLSAHIGRTGYRNRMIADERGLLRPLSGTSHARDYGLTAGWRLTPRWRLSASALSEDVHAGTATAADSHRSAFSVGLEQEDIAGRFHLHVLHRGTARFGGTDLRWRPQWGVEAAVERHIAGPDIMPDMLLTMRARSIADSAIGDPAPPSAAGLASRDLQPQIRVGLRARW